MAGWGLVTTEPATTWFRLSRRSNAALAALAELVDSYPEDLDGILETLAIVYPVMRDARGSYRNLPPADQYLGPHQAVIMTPFVLLGTSRFSNGTFGVLYGGGAIETSIAEVGYHQSLRLGASSLPYGTLVQLTSWTFRIATPLVDIRTEHAELHDRDSYRESQRFGRTVRERGDAGILYRSVRRPPNKCVGILRPRFITDVARGTDWRLLWDGKAISEWLEAR